MLRMHKHSKSLIARIIATTSIIKIDISNECSSFNNRHLFPNFNTIVLVSEEINIKMKAIIASVNKTFSI